MSRGEPSREWDGQISALRKGDMITVHSLSDLGSTFKELRTRLEAILARGAKIKEKDTGRVIKDKDTAAAILDAAETIGVRKRQERQGKARGGRPRIEWPKKKVKIMERHWYDSRHETNEDALEAMRKDGVDVDYRTVWRTMERLQIERGEKNPSGGSGRPPGVRPKE